MRRSAVLPGILTAILLLATGTLAPSAAAQPEPGLRWGGDYDLALEQALLTRQPVLLTFFTAGCPWCAKLERITFRAREVVDLGREMIPVRVNGNREKALAALFRVRGFPTTLVISRGGTVLGRIPGYEPPGAFRTRVEAALRDREPLEELRAGARQRPEDARAQYALGDALMVWGEYAKARTAFRRAQALSEAGAGDVVADARLDAGLTYLLSGDHGAAVTALAEFLERHPESDRRDQGRFYYGRALINMGKRAAGQAQIEAAAESTSFRFIREEAERLRAETQKGEHGG